MYRHTSIENLGPCHFCPESLEESVVQHKSVKLVLSAWSVMSVWWASKRSTLVLFSLPATHLRFRGLNLSRLYCVAYFMRFPGLSRFLLVNVLQISFSSVISTILLLSVAYGPIPGSWIIFCQNSIFWCNLAMILLFAWIWRKKSTVSWTLDTRGLLLRIRNLPVSLMTASNWQGIKYCDT